MKQLISSLTNKDTDLQDIFWTFVNNSVQNFVAELANKALELIRDEHINAGWNKHNCQRKGYRNGYYSRSLITSHGEVKLKVPRCRNIKLKTAPIFSAYRRRVNDVERVIRHAYLLGCSTRGLARLAEQIFGLHMSHQGVSMLNRWADQAVFKWRQQPIKDEYPVVYIDGMHVNRVAGDRVVMLVMGIKESGRKKVLGFRVGESEKCTNLLSELRERGLEKVKLFVSDDSRAIRNAVRWVYPHAEWQSCTFHKLANLRKNIGRRDFRNKMLAEAGCIFRCPSRSAALDQAAQWRERWQKHAGYAVYQFLEGLNESLSFYNLSEKWWKRTRTNNPMERLIRDLRQRLRPINCFYNDQAIERAVFGQLLRWHKIKLTHNT